MDFIQIFTILAVATGAVFLGASLFPHLRAVPIIPKRLRFKWVLMAALMSFFLIGYFSFLFIQVKELKFPLELLTSAVFFGGGFFVFLVTGITLQALRQIASHGEELRGVNKELVTKNQDLEEEAKRRKKAEQRAAARMHYLSSLHDIDVIISASLDLGVTLDVFLNQLVPQQNIDAAAVLLFNPHTQTVEYAAGKGFHGEAITRSQERLGQGTAGQVAFSRKMLLIPRLKETENEFSRQDLLKEERAVSYCAFPLIAKGEIQGVLEIYQRREFKPEAERLEFMKSLAIRAAIAIENAAIFNKLHRSNSELIMAYDTTIEGWGYALEMRDEETQGHTKRVANMTKEMAKKYGMRDDQLVHVIRGALLHDIGKMAISDSILMKDGPLTEEERELMQKHPIHAMEMLLPIPYLQPALDIPYCHHERWDGSGYPRGLKGTQIPLAARIFALADTWDALINVRRYHEAWSVKEVCKHIQSQSGKHFDPELVEIFLQMDWCRDNNCLLRAANDPVSGSET
jgi:putative nucleotidyltransferase with HDIG domain